MLIANTNATMEGKENNQIRKFLNMFFKRKIKWWGLHRFSSYMLKVMVLDFLWYIIGDPNGMI